MKILSLVLILQIPFVLLVSQNPYSPSQRLLFSRYLLSAGDTTAALKEADIITAGNSDEMVINKAWYFKGRLKFRQSGITSAMEAFDGVNRNASPEMYEKAGLGVVLGLIYSGKLKEAKEESFWHQFYPDKVRFRPYHALQNAGIALLESDFGRFEFIYENAYLAQHEVRYSMEMLKKLNDEYRDMPGKSPLLAGTLSAVLPGSGKFYAGKKASGASTLLTSIVLGLQTWEGYRRGGVKDWQFITFGNLFGLYYLGNIGSSVMHARRFNASLNTNFKNNVLLQISFPFADFFGAVD